MVRITIAFAIVTISGMLIFSGSARVSTSPTFREIPNPASHGSLAPGLSVTEEGIPILSWIEPSGTSKALKFAAWNGQSWAKPGTVLVNGEIEADSASPPTVVKLPSGRACRRMVANHSKGKEKRRGTFYLPLPPQQTANRGRFPLASIPTPAFRNIASTPSP